MSAEDRKTAIIEAALPLFARQGFAATTTKQLAQAAGVSEALIYRHFPSKKSLFTAIKGFGVKGKDEEVIRLLEHQPSTETLVLMVYGTLDRFVMGRSPHPMSAEIRTRLMVQSCLDDGEFMRFLWKHYFLEVLQKLGASIEAAIQAGDMWHQPDPKWLLPTLAHHLAVMIGCIHLPVPPAVDYGVPRKTLLQQATLFALRGIGLKQEAIERWTDWARLEAALQTLRA